MLVDTTNYDVLKDSELMLDYLQVKTNPLQFLYENKGRLFVYAIAKNKKVYKFEVYVKSMNEDSWDCYIVNYDLNFWCRTQKGRTGGKYKTIGLMINAIHFTLMNQLGVVVTHYEIMFHN
jgi:hypothetical protein